MTTGVDYILLHFSSLCIAGILVHIHSSLVAVLTSPSERTSASHHPFPSDKEYDTHLGVHAGTD